MVSLGMLIARPLSMAVRSAGLLAGSAPLLRAATEISRMILVNILPRLASDAFLRASIVGPRPMEISGPAGKPAILLEAGPPGLRAPLGCGSCGNPGGAAVAAMPLGADQEGRGHGRSHRVFHRVSA